MSSKPAHFLVPHLLALLLLLLSAGLGGAQVPDKPSNGERIAAWTAELERIEQTLKQGDLDDATLLALRGEIQALRQHADDFIAHLREQLTAAQSQLAKLGPAPKPEEPPESEAAARERRQLDKAVAEFDGAIRTAQVLQTRAGQLADAVLGQRRALFSQQLLKRVQSPLTAGLWHNVSQTIDSGFLSLRLLAKDWSKAVHPALLLVALAVFIVVWVLLAQIAARWVAHYRALDGAEPPDALRRTGSAAAVTLARALPPAAAAGAAYLTLTGLEMLPGRTQDLALAALRAFVIVTALAALIRTTLAPNEPLWRILPAGDREARLLRWLAAAVAVVYGLDLFLSDFNQILVTPLALTVAQKVISTVVIALLLAAIVATGLHAPATEAARPAVRHWARLVLWLLVIVILAATALGYVTFARFLISQMIVNGALLAVLYLLHRAVAALAQRLASQQTLAGRWLPDDPRRREQVALLVSVVLNAALIAAAVPLFLLQWGFDWDDVRRWLGDALFGFQFGGLNISLATILIALLLFVLGIIATRVFQHWLEVGVLRRTGMEQGARVAIGTVVGYLGIVLAALVAFAYTGLNFSNIAIVAGALSVGIGFGLQSIVNNFVSGVILLAERRISVGDWIIVGNEEGYVRRISVRATEIETFDRNYVIIPNAELITHTVKNWTFRHRRARVVIPIGVSYASDADQVRDVLIACAAAHPEVIENPAPRVWFDDFGDNALMFRLIAFIGDVDRLLATRSELRFAILRAFREAGIEIPFPQRDLHLKDIDRLERALAGRNRPQADE